MTGAEGSHHHPTVGMVSTGLDKVSLLGSCLDGRL